MIYFIYLNFIYDDQMIDIICWFLLHLIDHKKLIILIMISFYDKWNNLIILNHLRW
jgi:hypothetical protein